MLPSLSSFRNVDVGTFRGLARNSSVALDATFPRLIERNLPFHQSKNKVHIHHEHSRGDLYRLLLYNWFHVFLRLKTPVSLLILLVIWTSIILVFAGLYMANDRINEGIDCGLVISAGEPMNIYTAFAFSIETCTTVGYTLPGDSNAFFENCAGTQVLIYVQMTISMMFNAFLFSFFYARLAKSESRAVQVIFSDKIVVRVTERGTIVWQTRVYDVDEGHGIVESHVRMYALLKHKDADGHPQLVQLRIVSPNDELGGVLFLNIPTVVTHEMDYYSPLYPSYKDPAARRYRLSSGGLLLREVDSLTGNREEIWCPVCGESYGDFGRLRKHIKYAQLMEKKDGYPLQGSHHELKLEGDEDHEEDVVPKSTLRPSLEEVKSKLPLQELIVVVEGIDPLTSGTFQALHSYMAEDIEWHARFVPCMTSTLAMKTTFVDLEKFHQVECSKQGKSKDYYLFSATEGEESVAPREIYVDINETQRYAAEKV
jgi:hypothetical protein